MQVATTIGLIWAGVVIASGMISNIGIENVVNLYNTDPAQAAPVWLAIDSVRDGIGGGNEIIGGVWILLVSWAALQAGGLSKALNYLGVGIGVAGILSAVPALGMFTDIFGLNLNRVVHLVGDCDAAPELKCSGEVNVPRQRHNFSISRLNANGVLGRVAHT